MNNRANALQRIGERKQDVPALRTARSLLDQVLELYTRERAPQKWAATTLNLGNVLAELGSIEGDVKLSKLAAATYRSALVVLGEDTLPWSHAQFGLGRALRNVAMEEIEISWLDEAEDAFLASLIVRSESKYLVYRAKSLLELATVMLLKSDRTNDRSSLSEILQNANEALRLIEKAGAEFHIGHARNLVAQIEKRTGK